MVRMEATKNPCRVIHDIKVSIVAIILIGLIIMINPKKRRGRKKGEIERGEVSFIDNPLTFVFT